MITSRRKLNKSSFIGSLSVNGVSFNTAIIKHSKLLNIDKKKILSEYRIVNSNYKIVKFTQVGFIFRTPRIIGPDGINYGRFYIYIDYSYNSHKYEIFGGNYLTKGSHNYIAHPNIYTKRKSNSLLHLCLADNSTEIYMKIMRCELLTAIDMIISTLKYPKIDCNGIGMILKDRFFNSCRICGELSGKEKMCEHCKKSMEDDL